MAFSLHPGQRLDRDVRIVVRSEIDAALRCLRGGTAPLGERVHRARTCCKRVRAVLRLIAPCSEELFRRENAAFRNIARRLSAARDAEVMKIALAKLVRDTPGPRSSALVAVQRQLNQRLRTTTTNSREFREQLTECARELRRARRRVGGWKLSLRDDVVIRLGFGTGYRAARKALRRLDRRACEEDWHEWRKRSKVHGYHLRLLHEARKPLVTAMRREVDDLAEQLGDVHDLAVLLAALTDTRQQWGRPVAVRRLVGMIRKRRAALRRSCRLLGTAVFGDKAVDVVDRMQRWWKRSAGSG